MKRIMIIGCGGSGKSTFAKKIHDVTGIEVIHMDQWYWKPNWVEQGREEWEKIVKELVGRDSWIMDGNYGGSMRLRFGRADTIIYMDKSRWVCLFRIVKRLMMYYGRSRVDMAEGCKERITWEFVKYIFRYNKTRRPLYLKKLNQLAATKRVYILRNRKEEYRCLVEMRSLALPTPDRGYNQ